MRRALLVSVLGLLAAAGCGSSGSRAAPWVDRPLPLYSTPAPRPIRYPTSAPLCRAGELRVTEGRGGAATGHELQELVFRNVGPRTCLLRGYPTISAETPAGRRTALRPRHGTFFEPLLAADVAPRHHALLEVETDDMCASGRQPIVRYRNVTFSLPWGGSIGGGQLTIARQCGLAISELGLEERYKLPRARPGTPGTLRAAVSLPARVRAGIAELRYTVTLSNPTVRAVGLAPCPGYTEGIFAPGVAVHRSFALDCAAVRTIPAHGEARFAMRLPLPRPLPAARGPVKLAWSLDTVTGPFFGGAFSVAK